MEEFLIRRDVLSEVMYDVMVKACLNIPSDVKNKLREYLEQEKDEIARMHLDMTLRNCAVSEETGRLPCPDTGYPLFYIRLGDRVGLEGGHSALYEVCRDAVRRATADGLLRPNMVHPLTRSNPGTNTGYYIPDVDVRFDPRIDFLEIVAVPKGGGGEIFGTFYRMMVPADGEKGILKFILDCIRESTFAGKTCPPNIIGVGIGGTADLCMRIAKEAAILRPIGSRHPDPSISALEEELVRAVKDSGIGPMGMGGGSGILDLHVEYAACHGAGLPVAFNAQCSLSRRKVARIAPGHRVSYGDFPDWNYR
jgi:tartrate/fumarate subfamily iron-sulfur-dependent hydro-lyase alpha chain